MINLLKTSNKQNRSYIIPISLIAFLSMGISCKKYLDVKPVQSLSVPSTLDDLQAILDRYDLVNQKGPLLLETLSDNYYITTSTYNSRPIVDDRTNYVWDANATYYNNWYMPYSGPVYYSNVVQDLLPSIKIGESERTRYNNIHGAALFIRANAFWELAQLYCLPYSTDNMNEAGIVLRLNSNINEASVRSSVGQTYSQITEDLKVAATELPDNAIYPTRPIKSAALGLLARVYLSMRDYGNAKKFADSALKINNYLLDFNSLIPLKTPPVPLFNKEILYFNRPNYHTLLQNTIAKIDSTLIGMYQVNDLRKTVFFKANTDGTFGFQGSYEGTSVVWGPFDGVITDELYLIMAECEARSENINGAMKWLNSLLKTRWKSGQFSDITAATSAEALSIVLKERRKELVYRGLRWSDLRRLNIEGANFTLKRLVNNITYTLPPNDKRWVLLIPQEVISISNIKQNPR